MTIDNDVQIIDDPDREHVCGCGCGRLVGTDRLWWPSPNPREDLEATLEQRIADAVVVAEAEAEAKRPRVEQVLAQLKEVFEKQLTPRPIIQCPCCEAEFEPDEYRSHVRDETSVPWCDRAQWGSRLSPGGESG